MYKISHKKVDFAPTRTQEQASLLFSSKFSLPIEPISATGWSNQTKQATRWPRRGREFGGMGVGGTVQRTICKKGQWKQRRRKREETCCLLLKAACSFKHHQLSNKPKYCRLDFVLSISYALLIFILHIQTGSTTQTKRALSNNNNVSNTIEHLLSPNNSTTTTTIEEKRINYSETGLDDLIVEETRRKFDKNLFLFSQTPSAYIEIKKQVAQENKVDLRWEEEATTTNRTPASETFSSIETTTTTITSKARSGIEGKLANMNYFSNNSSNLYAIQDAFSSNKQTKKMISEKIFDSTNYSSKAAEQQISSIMREVGEEERKDYDCENSNHNHDHDNNQSANQSNFNFVHSIQTEGGKELAAAAAVSSSALASMERSRMRRRQDNASNVLQSIISTTANKCNSTKSAFSPSRSMAPFSAPPSDRKEASIVVERFPRDEKSTREEPLIDDGYLVASNKKHPLVRIKRNTSLGAERENIVEHHHNYPSSATTTTTTTTTTTIRAKRGKKLPVANSSQVVMMKTFNITSRRGTNNINNNSRTSGKTKLANGAIGLDRNEDVLVVDDDNNNNEEVEDVDVGTIDLEEINNVVYSTLLDNTNENHGSKVSNNKASDNNNNNVNNNFNSSVGRFGSDKNSTKLAAIKENKVESSRDLTMIENELELAKRHLLIEVAERRDDPLHLLLPTTTTTTRTTMRGQRLPVRFQSGKPLPFNTSNTFPGSLDKSDLESNGRVLKRSEEDYNNSTHSPIGSKEGINLNERDEEEEEEEEEFDVQEDDDDDQFIWHRHNLIEPEDDNLFLVAGSVELAEKQRRLMENLALDVEIDITDDDELNTVKPTKNVPLSVKKIAKDTDNNGNEEEEDAAQVIMATHPKGSSRHLMMMTTTKEHLISGSKKNNNFDHNNQHRHLRRRNGGKELEATGQLLFDGPLQRSGSGSASASVSSSLSSEAMAAATAAARKRKRKSKSKSKKTSSRLRRSGIAAGAFKDKVQTIYFGGFFPWLEDDTQVINPLSSSSNMNGISETALTKESMKQQKLAPKRKQQMLLFQQELQQQQQQQQQPSQSQIYENSTTTNSLSSPSSITSYTSPENRHQLGRFILPAVRLALDHINTNISVLAPYRLEIVPRDTQQFWPCSR